MVQRNAEEIVLMNTSEIEFTPCGALALTEVKQRRFSTGAHRHKSRAASSQRRVRADGRKEMMAIQGSMARRCHQKREFCYDFSDVA